MTSRRLTNKNRSQDAVKLSESQLKVMKVLWRHQKLSVAEVHQEMRQQKPVALTTVATLLKRLAEKGVVGFEKQGRQLLYYPQISEKETRRSMLASLLNSLFDGSPSELVHHLVAEDEIEQDDLDRIQQLLNQGKENE